MTDNDKALVEALRSYYRDLCGEAHDAADRMENLSAENDRLRDALKRIASGWPKPMQLARETLDRK